MTTEDWQARAIVAEGRADGLQMENEHLKRAVDQLAKPAPPTQQSRTERAVYGEAGTGGEAKAVRAEEHLCSDCLHAHTCEVAAVLERRDEWLTALARCAAYCSMTEQCVLPSADPSE